MSPDRESFRVLIYSSIVYLLPQKLPQIQGLKTVERDFVTVLETVIKMPVCLTLSGGSILISYSFCGSGHSSAWVSER